MREQQDLDEACSKHVKQKYEKVALSQKVLADLKARQQAELATGKVRRGSLACTCFQCQGCMSTSSLQAGCTAGAGRVCRGSLAWTCFHVPGVREAQACKWGAISTQQLHSSRLGVELSHSRLVTCMVCEVLGCWLLFAGCRSLVAGRWLLVAGCWLLVAGCWLPVAGRLPVSEHASSQPAGRVLCRSRTCTAEALTEVCMASRAGLLLVPPPLPPRGRARRT